MINTSPSVKPRVVILHMTASQLVRSIATLCKARAVPNAVARVSAGKWRCCREFRLAKDCRKSKLSILVMMACRNFGRTQYGKKNQYPQPLPELALPKACHVERK